jgi:hypothetical protein
MKPTAIVFLFLLTLFSSPATGASAQAQSDDEQAIAQKAGRNSKSRLHLGLPEQFNPKPHPVAYRIDDDV